MHARAQRLTVKEGKLSILGLQTVVSTHWISVCSNLGLLKQKLQFALRHSFLNYEGTLAFRVSGTGNERDLNAESGLIKRLLLD